MGSLLLIAEELVPQYVETNHLRVDEVAQGAAPLTEASNRVHAGLSGPGEKMKQADSEADAPVS